MLRAELSVHTNLSDDISVVDPRVILVGAPRYDVSAIAFTNLNNVQDFHNIAHCMNPYGVKIIYGAKVYCKKENKKFLVSLLVKNQRGLKNLYKIISSIDNEDSVSCVDFQTLQEHRENLIVGFCAKKPIEKDLTDFDFCEIHPTDVNEEREFYFGSNEEIYVIKEEVLECLNYAKEITDEENKVLTRLGIDYISFGDGLNWNRILNYE